MGPERGSTHLAAQRRAQAFASLAALLTGMPVSAVGREHRQGALLAADLDSVRTSSACVRLIAAHRTVLVPRDSVSSWRELCLCLCTSLLKTLSRTALVVTTVLSLVRLDRETQDFC